MDIATFLLGIVLVYFGRKQEITGAGLPMVVGGACFILFGAVWVLAKRFNVFPQ